MVETEPLYEIDEIVCVHGWTQKDIGTVTDVKEIFDRKLNRYVWGYSVDFEGRNKSFSGMYITEGYIEKMEKCEG